MSIFNEPFAAEEFFIDEWGEREVVDGIFSVTGFRVIGGERRAVMRFLTRVSTLADAMEETRAVLRDGAPTKAFEIAEINKQSH